MPHELHWSPKGVRITISGTIEKTNPKCLPSPDLEPVIAVLHGPRYCRLTETNEKQRKIELYGTNQ